MTTKRTPKQKTAKTDDITDVIVATPDAYGMSYIIQPDTQPEPTESTKAAIKAHENAISFIHTAKHRTTCAIEALTRSGYFTTVQYLQQANVHLTEAERSVRKVIREIRGANKQ
jgi:hypothetical protein